jgi:hypothetical protein
LRRAQLSFKLRTAQAIAELNLAVAAVVCSVALALWGARGALELATKE